MTAEVAGGAHPPVRPSRRGIRGHASTAAWRRWPTSCADGDAVLTLGAGNVWQAGDKLLEKLRSQGLRMAREAKKNTSNLRKVLWRVGLVALAVAICTGVSVHLVHRYLIDDPKFVLSHDRREALTIDGLHYGSRSKVQRIFAPGCRPQRFRRAAGRAPPPAVGHRLGGGRLRFAHLARPPVGAHPRAQAGGIRRGRVDSLLIDAQGMLLDPPPQAQFTFPVLSGVRAEDPPERRVDAVRCLLDVEEALGASMKDVSEVNAADPGNIRIVAQLDGRVVELILGEDNLGSALP